MSEATLKEKTAKGLLWGGFSNSLQQLLNLLFGIFLARLLTPDDYGMVGMLTIFSLIASTLQESGFTAALVNKKDTQHEDYNAVFWFNTLIGTTLYLILFCCAPLIADFFKQPALTALARYSFLGFLISSTGIAHNAYLFRHLMVKQNTIINVSSLFISGVVGVTLAYNGMAYWGIATQNITYILCITLQRWHYSPWKPTFVINFSPLRGMIAFSCRLLITNICQNINHNLLTVVIGRCFTKEDTGYFNQANKWNAMGQGIIQGMMLSVTHPVLSKVGEESERQKRVFRKLLRFAAFISFPTLFGLSLITPELITITITDKWTQSITLLQILCIGSAFIPIQNIYSNLIVSKGRSDIYMWSIVTQGIIQLLVAMCSYGLGMMTMVKCYVLINILWTFVWHALTGRYIHLSLWSALKDVLPFAIIAATIMQFTQWIVLSCSWSDNLYLAFLGKVIIAGVTYIAVMELFGVQIFKESWQYLRSFFIH